MSRTRKDSDFSVSPDIAVRFFQETLPFNKLDAETIDRLARCCKLDFFPKKTRILSVGETEINYLYLIQRGAVNTFITDAGGEASLEDVRGEGEFFGAHGIIQDSRSNLDVEAIEDTFCLLLPKHEFLKLIKENPSFAQYYLKSFSDNLVKTAYSELRSVKLKRRPAEDLFLFTNTVGDIVQRDPVMIAADDSIRNAATLMTSYHISSLLVCAPDAEGRVIGIITDRDLRHKVIAAGLNYNVPVSDIMSAPVLSVLSQAVCFDALIKMLSKGIHHLAVERSNRVIGVVTSSDIISLQGSSPYYFFKEIVAQQRISGLYPIAQRIPDVIRNLIKEGGKTSHITRMIAIINDHVLSRLLTLLEEELGTPPVPYCWLLMGSEGRREQTFKTDQDNALIYEDPANEEERERAEKYFAEFSEKAINHLTNCGYPPCPGKIMANNPKWRQPYSVWENYFTTWVNAPDPQELLHATIFFDFKGGFGHLELAENLRTHLIEQTRRQDIFLYHLARHTISNRVPLSFLRNLIVEKDGEHKNMLDIKHKGIVSFTDFARVLALKHGLKETNTLGRLKVLKDEGHLDPEVYESAVSSFELMMQLRLLHQLHQLEDGILPTNYLDPAQLGELERRMLKEGFRVLERLQSILATSYPPS